MQIKEIAFSYSSNHIRPKSHAFEKVFFGTSDKHCLLLTVDIFCSNPRASLAKMFKVIGGSDKMRLTVLSESDRHSDLTKYPCVPAEWA